MVKCDSCGKGFFLGKKYYFYLGTKKGSLKITNEKIECKDCFHEHYVEPDADEFAKVCKMIVDGKYNDALKIMNSNFNKNDASHWYSRGNILQNINRNAEALKCYDEALFLDTHYVKAWCRKGNLLFDKKKYKDALRCFSNVNKLDKITKEGKEWSGLALFMVALCHHNLKQYEKSTRIFKTLQATFNFIETHYNKDMGFNKIGGAGNLDFKEFHAICLTQWQLIAHNLEPQMIAEILEMGARH